MSSVPAGLSNLIINFLVAFGMVVGGSILGGIGLMVTSHHQSPLLFMVRLSDRLKIWAMVGALGGSMDALKVIGDGVWSRQLSPVGKQLAYLIVAFVGCQLGALMIHWLAGGDSQG